MQQNKSTIASTKSGTIQQSTNSPSPWNSYLELMNAICGGIEPEITSVDLFHLHHQPASIAEDQPCDVSAIPAVWIDMQLPGTPSRNIGISSHVPSSGCWQRLGPGGIGSKGPGWN
jgi:hypothetical protein